MFDSYLEARLQAAPLLLEIFGACKQTWSRKASLCAASAVSPAPKAPLLHTCGLDRFKCTSRGLLESSPIVVGDFWGLQANMV